MRKTSAFRPRVLDRLEDRLVLSHVSVAAKPAAVHQRAPASAQQLAANQVADAYSTFVTNFTEAVNVDLYAPSVSGAMGNAAFFSQQLGQELTTLTTSVVNVVKSAGAQPAGSPAVTAIKQAINGSSSSSLRSRLSALTLSSLEVGSAISSFEGTAVQTIQQNYIHVKKDVLADLPAPTTTSTSSSTT
jgi:hypothetical protein